MTQYASPEAVQGDFDDVRIPYFDSTYHLNRIGEEFWATVDGKSRRIVQVTGSHHYQVYWLESDGGNALENLPLVYLMNEKKWVRRNEAFVMPPEVGERRETVQVWNHICIDCHTTHGQPKLDSEQQIARTNVGEIGIACEACHGPANEHVSYHSNPVNRYTGRLTDESAAPLVNPAELTHERSADVCGQCHSIFAEKDEARRNLQGFAYRAGDELMQTRHVLRHPSRELTAMNNGLSRAFLDKYFWPDGMVRVSGREYNGLVETACYQRGELSCLSCHSMHSSDPDDQLRAGMRGDDACLQCHSDMADRIFEHTHHDASSSGSRCYNCHMPHTTLGLMKAIRSHEVSSPNVSTTMATGRPNACNLCHLDQTLGWTNKRLTDWYGAEPAKLDELHETTSAALLWMLTGDAAQRAIVGWHAGWGPALEVSGSEWLAPYVAELFRDPYPVVRSIAGNSLPQLPGMEDVNFDFTGSEEEREQSAQQVTEIWNSLQSEKPSSKGEEVLLEQGKINYSALFDLLNRRNNQPVDLLE